MKDWTENIISHWNSEGVRLNEPAAIEKIRQTEAIIDFSFPDKFIQLYLKTDGFYENDWTKNMFSLWPLYKIIEEYKKRDDINFVGFTDYLIFSHEIGFFKNQKGVYKNYENETPIAADFEEVLNLINSNSILIY